MKKLFLLTLLFLSSCQLRSCNAPDFVATIERDNTMRNVILIGWDGVRRDLLNEFRMQNKMPNLQLLIDSGTFVETEVNKDLTQTKPGWSQILSGFDASVTGVYSDVRYKPIPKGLTVFERLKEKFGKSIYTAFITGKISNTGARGPHKLCVNCLHPLEDSLSNSEENPADTKSLRFGKKKVFELREGEPFFNALPSIDFYKNSLEEWPNVMSETRVLLKNLKDKQFFAFIHFIEPDRFGHTKGGDSKQYRDALLTLDEQLGVIFQHLKDHDIAKNTALFITTDHGFGHGHTEFTKRNHNHFKEPQTFLVSSLKSLRKKGDRRDFAPTLLEFYGIDPKQFHPPMSGQSLIPAQ